MNHLKKHIVWRILLSIFIFSTIFSDSLNAETIEEESYILEKDIVYGTGDDIDLTLDLARPAQGTGPFPTLVFLFGGGYSTGSKRSWFDAILKAAQRGYVAVSIDYRLTSALENDRPRYPFPAQVYNGKCAIRWLRSNADTYAIDSSRIGVVGYSAGGNLALMLGLTEASDGLEGNCGDERMSSRVQALINIAGVTDWVKAYYDVYPRDTEALLSGLPEQVPGRYTAASPLTYVNPDAPPVLSIYGNYDPLFPQGEMLDEKMKAVGASHTLIVKEAVGHAQFALVDFSEGSRLWEFLDSHLKTTRRMHLRSQALVVSKDDASEKFGLTEWDWKPLQYVQNSFEDQGETVLDRATGLMWQKIITEEHMGYEDVLKYIKTLNEQKFAGYDDWRLPTIPELLSLLTPTRQKESLNFYLDPIFPLPPSGNYHCWSADRLPPPDAIGWKVSFVHSRVPGFGHLTSFVRAVRNVEGGI